MSLWSFATAAVEALRPWTVLAPQSDGTL